jgi:hypothetical protein
VLWFSVRPRTDSYTGRAAGVVAGAKAIDLPLYDVACTLCVNVYRGLSH